MTGTSRLQQLVPSTLILAVALIVAWLSFTQEPAGAFLFPRVISVAFAGLAAWNFGQALLAAAPSGDGLNRQVLLNILPGLAMMLAYVFFIARGLGFYAGSALTFLIVYAMYDPVPLTKMDAWPKRLAITLGFMAVIYVLFALVLKVQTPRGLLF